MKKAVFILTFLSLRISAQNFELVFESGQGLWLGSALWADFNDDGFLDFIVSGESPQDAPKTWIFQGNGLSFELSAELEGLQRSSTVCFDYDRNGTIDVLIAGKNKNLLPRTLLYRNEGDLVFSELDQDLPDVFDSGLDIADYNNDGWEDILISGENSEGIFISELYRNVEGSSFEKVSSVSFPGVRLGTVNWGDYDNDGLTDFLITGEDMNFSFPNTIFRNLGNDQFIEVNTGFTGLMFTGADWGDIDNDGDLDIITSGETMFASFVTKIYRNNGRGQFSEILGDYENTMNGTARFGDLNSDGALDVFATGVNDRNSFTAVLYEGGGSSFFKKEVQIPGLGLRSSGIPGDFNNDNRLDILVTGGDSELNPVIRVYENKTGEVPLSDSPPVDLYSTVTGNMVEFEWSAPSNASGTFNIKVGTRPGADDVVSSYAFPDGQRKIQRMGNAGARSNKILQGLKPGIYYWSVQCVNHSFLGSPFSEEQSFEIGEILNGEEEILSGTVDVYPNPFKEKLFIEPGIYSVEKSMFSLYNVYGQVVKSGELKNGNEELTMTDLASGVYTVRIQSGETVFYKRIVKTN